MLKIFMNYLKVKFSIIESNKDLIKMDKFYINKYDLFYGILYGIYFNTSK
jgi:hypothetical protein